MNDRTRGGEVLSVDDRIRGRQILITGTTGYIGKVLLERVMAEVPGVGVLHLLVRANRNHSTARERFVNEIAASSVFDGQRQASPGGFAAFCEAQVRCVTGEITQQQFGLSDADYAELVCSVDAVVHVAASVNFREGLDQALQINTLCLQHMVQFARDAGDIPFVHVSTCYVNGKNPGDQREGNVAPAGADMPLHPDGHYEVEQLIELLQRRIAEVLAAHGDETREEALTSLGVEEANRHGWRDVYTFTKWMGEQVLRQRLRGSTLTIVRPSIVGSCHTHPTPGWIEGIKVTDTLLLAYARGKLSFFPARKHGVIDYVPADFVANALIMALAEALGDAREHRIYQVCTGAANPVTVGQFIEHLTSEVRDNHARYPALCRAAPKGPFRSVPKDVFLVAMRAVRRPLAAVDRVLAWLGRAPLPALAVVDKTIVLSDVFSPYSSPDYIFHGTALAALSRRLAPDEHSRFPVDPRIINWEHYLRDVHVSGVDRYGMASRRSYSAVKSSAL